MNKETILVVDDNRQLAHFTAEKLLPSLGYQSRIAYDGQSALESIRTSQPSLMLLDLELPDTNGLELLRTLANESLSVPTILVTAHGSEQIAADAFRLGVHDYLTKPVEAEKLEEAITRALTETRLRKEAARLTAQLKEQVEWLNVLAKVGQSITSTLDLSEVLRRIVEAGVQVTSAEEGFLALLDRNSGQLVLRAVKNIEVAQTKTLRLPVKDSLTGEAIHTGRPIRITSDESGLPLKVSTGFLVKSLLHVPILSKGQPIGVLSVQNRINKRPFTYQDETMLTSLADYASIALENANLYNQAQYEIEERKRIEHALRESEERYARAVQGANDGIWDWDLKTNKIYYSTRWKTMLGYNEGEIVDDPNEWLNRIHPNDVEKVKLDLSAHIRGVTKHFENEHRMRHKDGSFRWMSIRGLAVRDQDSLASRIAGSQTDITDRKYAEARLLHDAFYDRLTGLPNRALFMDRLHSAIERAKRRNDYLFAVLFLDLDQFKNINDSLGHPAGDQLLIAVANTLKTNLRSMDTVARLGGDEFVILLEDIRDPEVATKIATWILGKFSAPMQLADNEVFITTSIGIVLGSLSYERPEDILRDADIAMYEAKTRGKATYAVFTPVMREQILKRVELEANLRQAIENNQIVIYYQPIFSFKNRQVVSFEALIRWQHPKLGIIQPAGFIPLAHEAGLITSIDRWVLKEACLQTREWQVQYNLPTPVAININITSKLVAQPDFIQTIKQILESTALAENTLRLEITESTIMENNETISNVIKELKQMGVEIHIDDFGTGYSSLTYLRQFAFNVLKIDRSFVQQMGEQTNQSEIIRTIIGLAHDLGMQACAEGIETEVQLTTLKDMGCDFGQGFLFSVPLPPNDVEELLKNIKSR